MMKNKEKKWWKPEIYMNDMPKRLARNRILKEIRRYFETQNFIEVQTPAVQISPGSEVHLRTFQTTLCQPFGQGDAIRYLHTSPEITMKKLIVAGMENIFQMCPVYRNEEIGATHSPEFTMLEWYRKGADYTMMMSDTENIVKACANACEVSILQYENITCDVFDTWERLSVRDAFLKYAQMDILDVLPKQASLEPDARPFIQLARLHKIRCEETDRWEDVFFRVMFEKIESHLGHQRPTILYDYPTCLGALARQKESDERFVERFEAYICGVELCNAFSELTDPAEQEKRFLYDQQMKQKIYGLSEPIDEDFLDALRFGMPTCAGNALGVERLIMLITNASDIVQVAWAPVC